MVYRIRYCDDSAPDGAEVIVEAATPTEALVKFCHTHTSSPDPTTAHQMVTSISAESAEHPYPAE